MTPPPLRHLLTLEGLDAAALHGILDTAAALRSQQTFAPPEHSRTLLNLFFENSTRTRFSFEFAAARLGLRVLNFDVEGSSIAKGESLRDTLQTLRAMRPDIVVIRHSSGGAAAYSAEVMGDAVAVINAGDGFHAHPTQALLDLMTIRDHRGGFDGLALAIVGDVRHSRVARSLLQGLRVLGVEDLRLIGPATLLPSHPEALGARSFTDLAEGLAGVEAVIALRLQNERMLGASLLPSAEEYRQGYGLDDERLGWAAPGAFVLHPGPINRGVEISAQLADSERSLILRQVENGVWVRMAVMQMLLGRTSG